MNLSNKLTPMILNQLIKATKRTTNKNVDLIIDLMRSCQRQNHLKNFELIFIKSRLESGLLWLFKSPTHDRT